MPNLIGSPTRIEAAGTPPKIIDEYIGYENTGDTRASIAHMRSPHGWSEPGQQPEFHEYTLVLKGILRVEYKGGVMDVEAGQAVHTKPGEWIRYSTPAEGGAEYISVCMPAFTRATVHRDE